MPTLTHTPSDGHPGALPDGTLRLPGDKSITHRALLLAALAPGTSCVRGALDSLDTRATADALRGLGVRLEPARGHIAIGGRTRLSPPAAAINCRNSGTTARLLAGLLAAHPFVTSLTGDASLRSRPMRRATDPLCAMGARIGPDPDRLPFQIHGGALRPVRWRLPVASAQAKSAVLLAGLAAGVGVELAEPASSRDHTERLLRWLGCEVATEEGWLRLTPSDVRPFELEVPGDSSSAAFLAAAALLAAGGALRLHDVGVNPTRAGWIDAVVRMGGSVSLESPREAGPEPVAALVVRAAPLRAIDVAASEAPRLIDEVPVLAVLAARAEGTSVFRGLAELRTKESDRLALLAENLRAVGGAAEVSGDDLYVSGTDAPPRGRVRTAGDHRIAMAFTVLGTVRGAALTIDEPAACDVSYPEFPQALAAAVRTLS